MASSVFYLRTSGLSDDELCEALETLKETILDVSNRKMSNPEKFFGALRHARHIATLCVTHSAMKLRHVAELSKMLSLPNALVKLNLAYNQMTTEMLTPLCQTLAKNHTLTHLDMMECNIDQPRLALVAKMLLENTTLKELMLGGNPFRISQDFADACISHPSLTFLGLNNHRVWSPTENFWRLISESRLEHLDISDNDLASTDLLRLCELIRLNRTPHSLDISHCLENLGDADLDESSEEGEHWGLLFDALEHNTTLTALNAEHYDNVPPRAQAVLSRALLHNETLTSLHVPVRATQMTPELFDAIWQNEKLDFKVAYNQMGLYTSSRRHLVAKENMEPFLTLLSIFSANLGEALFFHEAVCHQVWREQVRVSKLNAIKSAEKENLE